MKCSNCHALLPDGYMNHHCEKDYHANTAWYEEKKRMDSTKFLIFMIIVMGGGLGFAIWWGWLG